jgi:hypothetical protein
MQVKNVHKNFVACVLMLLVCMFCTVCAVMRRLAGSCDIVVCITVLVSIFLEWEAHINCPSTSCCALWLMTTGMQAAVTRQGPVQNLLDFLADPVHNNLLVYLTGASAVH